MSRSARRALPARAVLCALTALSLLGAMLVAVALPAGAAPASRTFSAPIEPLARYEGQTTCDPTEKPGTIALRSLVQASYPSVNSGGISRSCDVGGRSEHKEGRAWDWMLDASDPVEAERARDFLQWLLATDAQGNRYANARRLGVMYVIWDHQVWESYAADDGWTTYSGPVPHTDHIHVSLSWDGAMKRTSFWSGSSSPTPSPTSSPSPSPTSSPTPTPTGSPTNHDPFGRLDAVVPESDGVRVRGWVIDPDASTFATVRITADGATVGQTLADQHSDYLVTAQPGYSPRHGFETVMPIPSGAREICATGINQNQGKDVVVGCTTLTATSVPSPAPTPTPTPTTAPPPSTAPAPLPPTRGTDDSCPPWAVPGSAFTDTVGSVHADTIDCVVWWELTGGVSATSYAPAQPVSRAQMATFLARTVVESGGMLPAAPRDFFDDDEDSIHEPAINRLAAVGISAGTGGRSYDPAGQVTRAQMATFLTKTWSYRTGRVLPDGADYFSDDDGNVHEASIGKVARAGFTGGVSPSQYGPLVSTDRGQMATFLARLLDLLVEAGDAEARG